MNGWKRWGVIGIVALGFSSGAMAATSEVEILLNKLIQKGVLTQDEAGEIRKEIASTQEERNTRLAKELVPASSRDWIWSGDIRLRNEYRNRTGSGTDINRQRIRFRYGFEAKVSPELKVGARLATGNTTEPTSTNQSFNTSFNHKTIVLDRAYAAYTPEVSGLSHLSITGGMFENPFWVVGPLVWDEDVNFDGLAVHAAKAIGPVTVFTNDGIFPLQTDISEAAVLWSTQGGLAFTPFANADQEILKHLKWTGALAYHDYKNVTKPLTESTALATAGGSKGNSAGIQDLNLLNPTVELSSQYGEIPFGIFGDWVHNTAVGEDNNGFHIGLRGGKARVPFDLRKGWEAGYFFERLDPDATFGALTDGDFGNGGTNHRGHAWWVKLATLKNSTLQLRYFNTQEVTGSKNHADTLQADWVTKF